MITLASIKLSDQDAERVRQSHADAIRELQGQGARVLKGVLLPASTDVFLSHGLGRAPTFVTVSVPIGPGGAGSVDIHELRGLDSAGRPIDATKLICLRCDLSTVRVDVKVEAT